MQTINLELLDPGEMGKTQIELIEALEPYLPIELLFALTGCFSQDKKYEYEIVRKTEPTTMN